VSKTISQFQQELPEKDEHKKSREYKKLSPKMKDAVDAIFKEMESKPSDFLNTFDKTINSVSKKFKVPPKKLLDYFETELLSI
jgi:glucan phosphorylase|tara:strand:- start:1598 stop:1846 length:249 start_codon:yes stop_codon:yes gene_type:complete